MRALVGASPRCDLVRPVYSTFLRLQCCGPRPTIRTPKLLAESTVTTLVYTFPQWRKPCELAGNEA